MQKLILYGCNSLAKELIAFSKEEPEYSVSYICVDRAYMTDSSYEGVPVVAFEDLDTLDMQSLKIVLTFGYSSMNGLREEKFNLCKKYGYQLTNFISSRASIYTSNIGESNIIMPHTLISSGVSLGNGNIFYPSIVVGHDCRIGNFNYFGSCVDVLGKVIIENRCFLGGNSTILNTRQLADETLVGAGAVVSKNTKTGQVVVPPRSIVLQKTSKDFY